MTAHVQGTGWAVPAPMSQEGLWREFFADRYGHDPVAARIWQHSGVVTRHGVADPRSDDVSDWTTGQRMRRFATEALPLGKEAVAACLTDAGLQARDIGQFTVVSCTGYATPGLDVLLAHDLGMPVSTQRLHVGHMGCYAALPALASAADTAAARGKVAVVLCLELPSLHIQPPPQQPAADMDQVVAHALFSDAAAAVAITPGGPGLEVLDIVARTASDRASLMTWDITDLGFRMGLSPEIPDVLSAHVAAVVTELLEPHGVGVGDVTHWAIHPGGPRIVDVVAQRLGLAEQAVADSRRVLADHGNCSSATVLLILDRILATSDLQAGDPVVAMAFGPGLTLYATLLRAT